MELSLRAKTLLEQYQLWHQSLQSKTVQAVFAVDEVASKVASFYEKIRGVLDWREEHLLRKTAIERIFKRRMLFVEPGKDFGEDFLQELIRGGHLPNNRVPVAMAETMQRLVEKYVFLHEHIQVKNQPGLQQWLFTIAACEIEEMLSNPIKERALIDCMSYDMVSQVFVQKSNEDALAEQERKLIIEIAVQRALFKLDDATISLHLLEKFYPVWTQQSLDAIAQVPLTIARTQKQIEELLRHDLGEKFYHLIERLDTPYLLLGDVIAQNPNDFLRLTGNSPEFEEAIKHAYGVRLKKLTERTHRAMFFSTISVLISKLLLALFIETRIEQYLTNHVNLQTLALSIGIPPLFLLFFVFAGQSSSQENLQKVLLEIMRITYASEEIKRYELAVLKRKKQGIIRLIVQTVYGASFFFSFGTMAWLLTKLHFTPPSIVIFLFFLSLVVFAGTKIRQRSRELMIIEEKEGFLSGVFDLFSLPMIQAGKWLSGKLARYNILIVALNVLIEMPFQVFVEFIEQLRNFWKEKKEEIH